MSERFFSRFVTAVSYRLFLCSASGVHCVKVRRANLQWQQVCGNPANRGQSYIYTIVSYDACAEHKKSYSATNSLVQAKTFFSLNLVNVNAVTVTAVNVGLAPGVSAWNQSCDF
jgi:hypothetical protein